MSRERFTGTARVVGRMVEVSVSLPLAEGPDPHHHDDARKPEPAPDAGPMSHSRDFSQVRWGSTTFLFTRTQRLIVAALWNARDEGFPWVEQGVLLEAVESDGGRVRDVFRTNVAWGVMIVSGLDAGGPVGSYRIADPPS